MSSGCDSILGWAGHVRGRTGAIWLGCLGLLASANGAKTTIYVSTSGNDAWSGNLSAPNASHTDGPKATLEGARLKIRLLKQQMQLSPEGAQVLVLPGRYPLSAGLTFGANDSGTASAPIIYKSTVPRGAILDGGKVISNWTPVRDRIVLRRLTPAVRKRVVESNLPQAGISDLGSLKARGAWQAITSAPLELVVEDAPARIAQWPNGGWSTIQSTSSLSDFVAGPQRSRTSGPQTDVWVQGYFGVHWADYTLPLNTLDRTTGVVRMSLPVPKYGMLPNMRYRILNSIEELDRPGEYYVDRSRNKLYFYPPASVLNLKCEATVLESNFLTLYSAQYMEFQGFQFRNARSSGIYGTKLDHVSIINCGFKNLGNRAMTIGGTNLTIQSNDITNMGYGAIYISGGDRVTLAPSGNVVANNQISNLGRWTQSGWESGVYCDGVGIVVSGNAIYDVPSAGIIFRGNDHIIEKNEIIRVCKEVGDHGVIYCMGADMTYFGNRVRDNMIRDCVTGQNTANYNLVSAIYLDQFTCGTRVEGNAIINCSNAFLLGGGSDNVYINNLLISTGDAAHIDARGKTYQAAAVAPGGTVYSSVHGVNLSVAPWTKYNVLSQYPSEDLGLPKRNVFLHNLWLDSGTFIFADPFFSSTLNPMSGNIIDSVASLVDAAQYDFGVKNGTLASTIPFVEIVPSQIGLQVDAYRLTIPDLRTTSTW